MDKDLQKRMEAGAQIIADEARRISSGFSRRTAAATKVVVTRRGVVSVVTDGELAPMSAPFEWAERHPLFGNRHWWYKQPHRPYMEVARDRKLDACADEVANVLTDWAAENGFH